MGRRPTTEQEAQLGRRLGERLRDARTAKELSQEDLARRAGVGMAWVKRIEDGRVADPGFFKVVAVAKELEVQLDDLQTLQA